VFFSSQLLKKLSLNFIYVHTIRRPYTVVKRRRQTWFLRVFAYAMFRLNFNNVSFQIKKKVVFFFLAQSIVANSTIAENMIFIRFTPKRNYNRYDRTHYVYTASVTDGNERVRPKLLYSIYERRLSTVSFFIEYLYYYFSTSNSFLTTAFVSFTNTFANDNVIFDNKKKYIVYKYIQRLLFVVNIVKTVPFVRNTSLLFF